ncbi:MAG: ferrous iron transport protein B [Armatimonadota bacterium]|nr:ferrous iron transport protein B [Armatimonadota bacterium]
MDCTSRPASKVKAGVRRIALVGNPNVGKSAVFGLLTGKYVTVSNYPGTTVEVTQGNCALNGRSCVIIDTPGANSLTPMSEDEKVTRDIVFHERPEMVAQVADAKNPRRALVISSQLAELDVPFVLVLNMADEASSRGIKTNTKALSDLLGIPVVSTVATQRKGLDRLIHALAQPGFSGFRISYDSQIEAAVSKVESLLGAVGPGKRGIAMMLLAGDESLNLWLHANVSEHAIHEIELVRRKLQDRYQDPLSYVINLQRLRCLDDVLNGIVTTDETAHGRRLSAARAPVFHPIFAMMIIAGAIYGLWEISNVDPLFAVLALPVLVLLLYLFGQWGAHPVYGGPMMLAVLYLTWLFVGKFGAGTMVDWLENGLFGHYLNPWATKAVALIPVPFVRDLLVGEYGIITMALTYAVAIVLPIVGAFFVTFGALEDSGYLPRLAIMVNRIFKVMGLNGKAVLPMILGLGCDTMATLTCRILETKRDRVIVTLLLALGVPCSAQLGVILGILGPMPFAATGIWIGVVVGIIFIVGYLASKVMPGTGSDFILEVPPVRWPQMSNILVKTAARVEWYLREAVPLFVLGTLLLFTLERLGMMSVIIKVAAPVVQGFLGLPGKTTEAFVIGFLRRDYGVAGLYALVQAGKLTNVQVVVSLVTITLFVPCIANFFVVVKERGVGTAIAMSAFIFPFAFLIGGLLNLALHALGIRL